MAWSSDDLHAHESQNRLHAREEGDNVLLKRIDPEGLELEERAYAINRVMRVRKGGRTPSFNALSVVGNHEGIVGVGFGKANEVPEAIRKSIEDAKKNLIKVPIVENTIPHEAIGVRGAGRVLIKPASPGAGIIAGSVTKVIMEFAGVHDVVSKCLGSRNVLNMAAATIDALKQLKRAEDVARLRGKTVEELLG